MANYFTFTCMEKKLHSVAAVVAFICSALSASLLTFDDPIGVAQKPLKKKLEVTILDQWGRLGWQL